MVVDLTDYSEVAGAVAVDLDAQQVVVRQMTYSGEMQKTITLPCGVRLVRRR